MKLLDSFNEIVFQGKENSLFNLTLSDPDTFHENFSETKRFDYITSLKSRLLKDFCLTTDTPFFII